MAEESVAGAAGRGYTTRPERREPSGHVTRATRLKSCGRAAAAGVAIAGGWLAPRTLLAQVEIGPHIGFYLPKGALIRDSSASSSIEKRQEGAILVGASGLFMATQRLGVAANVTFAPSAVAVTDSFGTRDESAVLVLADARLVARLTPVGGLWSLSVGAGAGVASRGGSVWAYSKGVTAPTFVASISAGTPLYGLRVARQRPYPPPRVVLRMELADRISRAQFDKGLPTETAPRMHHDVTFSVIFAIRVRS